MSPPTVTLTVTLTLTLDRFPQYARAPTDQGRRTMRGSNSFKTVCRAWHPGVLAVVRGVADGLAGSMVDVSGPIADGLSGSVANVADVAGPMADGLSESMAKGIIGESSAVQLHPWGSLASTCTGLDEGKFFFQGGDNGCEGGG